MKTISDYRNCIPRTEYDPGLKATLVAYMTQRKLVYGASTAKIKDYVTGERIYTVCKVLYRDDEYEWRSEEAYLVDKYDMKVSDDFIQHVMSKG